MIKITGYGCEGTKKAIALIVGKSWKAWKVSCKRHGLSPNDEEVIREYIKSMV